MRPGSVTLDMPRWLSRNFPWWLARANTVVALVTVVPAVFLRQPGMMILWFAWVVGVFIWGYRAWGRAGRPAIDEPTVLDFRWRGLKSVWPDRNEK